MLAVSLCFPPPSPSLSLFLLLRRECALLVGRTKFVEAFEYLKTNSHDSSSKKIAMLTEILGKERVKHWEKIDELVFMEKNNS
jgi:hypothetical protein